MTSDFARLAYGSFARLGPGRRIAGYLIEEQIGAGGMAVVFRARDEVLGRLVAVKVIAPSMSDDEGFRVRFLRESRAAAAIRSLHIIPVYGAGEAEGLLYIATQFVAGGDLAGLVRRSGGRLAPRQVASFVSQVASALDAAHAAGLVHRDVKPGNILVDTVPERPEHAFLADFGLSKGTAAQSSVASLTATGQFVGTPDYCAPEQVMGLRVDGRADQYALGCVAFTLLTGSPPFRRQETMATLFAQLHEPVPAVSGLRPELPAGVDRVIERVMAKAPAARYGTCGEFAAALQHALTPARTGQHHTTQNNAPALPSTRLPPGQYAPASSEVSLTSAPTDLLRPTQSSRRGPVPPALTTDGTTPIREPARHASTVGNGGADRNGAGRHGAGRNAGRRHAAGSPVRVTARGRRNTSRIWAVASPTVVLAAGALTVLLLHHPPPTTPSAHPQVSQTIPRTSSAAASTPGKGDAIPSRELTGGGYGFNSPDGIASDGTRVWVVNSNANSVTEINASNGRLIRVLKGASYGFYVPYAIASDGTRVWVVNSNANSVTEINAADGTPMRSTRTDTTGRFAFPNAIALGGTYVWVINEDVNSIAEINASNGSLIRTLTGASYGFNSPQGIAADGTHVWVTNGYGDSVTEINAADGSLIRTLTSASYGLIGAGAIADDGTHVWVVNNGTDSVTEINASDGSLIRVLKGASYGFNKPGAIAFGGTYIWVVNNDDTVTEINAADGAPIRTLNGTSYGYKDQLHIAADPTHVWIANERANSVTQLTPGTS
jgi:serine/threonine-protein kinase